MALSEYSAVMMEARAAVQTSHKLLDEMRILKRQLHQSLNAVQASTAALVVNLNVTAAGTAFGERAARIVNIAPSPELIALDSHQMAAGVEPVPEAPAPRQIDPKDQIGLDLLTPREIEVLRLIGEGQRTKEIAFTLGITFKTAVTHRSNIMEKLGIHEGPRLVRFAIRTGIARA